MDIERLRPEHWQRLRALRLAALADAPDAFGSTLEATRRVDPAGWRGQIERLATFVAVLDGDDVGMVRGAPDPDRPTDAVLLSMWVAPQARRCGTGRALIDAVADWADAAGFERLLLDVADHNTAAVALYAGAGFEPTGETGTLPAPRTDISEHRRARRLKAASA